MRIIINRYKHIKQDVREAHAKFFPEQECDPVTASARMNKSNFTTERKSCSVHMTVIETVVHHNVDNWIQLLA